MNRDYSADMYYLGEQIRKIREEQYMSDQTAYQLSLSDNLDIMKTHIEGSTESLFAYLNGEQNMLIEMYDAEVRIITLFESFEDMWTKYFIEHSLSGMVDKFELHMK